MSLENAEFWSCQPSPNQFSVQKHHRASTQGGWQRRWGSPAMEIAPQPPPQSKVSQRDAVQQSSFKPSTCGQLKCDLLLGHEESRGTYVVMAPRMEWRRCCLHEDMVETRRLRCAYVGYPTSDLAPTLTTLTTCTADQHEVSAAWEPVAGAQGRQKGILGTS
jgi:hypothetical protein